jgi:hypothetical protein
VPHAERVGRHFGPHFWRELEQPNGVGDGRSILANARGDLVVGEVKLGGQALERRRFLDRIEILALQVLDQRPLE